MWVVSGREIRMTEGDYGVTLPIAISGVTLGAGDSILFTLKKEFYRDTVFTVEFTNITDNTVNLNLTSAQSEALTVGNYIYNLDWYQSGTFMCNLVNGASFKVVAKN